MIPKIIHYCWFGHNPKSELAERCIGSWKKKCHGYQIIEWNEDSFDLSKSPLYVQQAYEAKKWAFVTDYVRLYAMTNYGGIYMDTDVEVIKSLNKFLTHEAFSGFEDETNIPTGIMACRKDFPLFKELLKYYDSASFYNEDGSFNLTTNVTIITNMCLSKGLIQNNQYQVVDGFALYPKDVFCPVSYQTGKLEKTRKTVTIHWFAGSWQSEENKKQIEKWRQAVQREEQQKRNQKRQEKKDYIIHTPNRVLRRLLGEKNYDNLKSKLK